MKKILLSSLLLFASAMASRAQVVINELDADQPQTDAAEFVELIGEPNTSLDGLVVVFINGNNDQAYAAFDLDGYSTDANGLFVLGNVAITSAQITFPDNTLQNGQDAVAIYTGNAEDWPAGAVATNINLVDAVVYDTQDADDTVLLDILTPGQPQIDENGDMNGVFNSISRVPDGGAPFNTSLFFLQTPTPGAFNAPVGPVCDAGTVAVEGLNNPAQLCNDQDYGSINFTSNSAQSGDGIWFIVTNTSGDIVTYNEDGIFNFDEYELGNYQVYSFSFIGEVDLLTLQAGLPISGVTAAECSDVSTSFITIQVIDCSVPVCIGGSLQATSSTTFCSNTSNAELTFEVSGNQTEGEYAFILTDENNVIIQLFDGNSFITDDLEENTYRVWGLSFYGTLDPSTIEAGDDATTIITDGACTQLSTNFITLNIVNCEFENGCQTLIISQYYEGTAFNKAIELYNTSNFPIDLDEYELFLYANGSVDITNAFAPLGILPGGETFLIVHPQADPALLAIADTTSNVVNFNGDDAIILQENLVTIDVVGQVGEDPGTFWTIPAGTTQDNSLIRFNYVTEPNAEWSVTQNQYFSVPIAGFESLGNHDFLQCSNIPQMGFEISAISVDESIGQVELVVNAYNIPSAVEVQVTLADGTALAGEDFVNDNNYNLSFAAGNSSQSVFISIIDEDTEEDLGEFFTATLGSASQVDFIVSQVTITIEPNDQSYPLYNIEDVRDENEFGVMDSIGVFCELRGIVHGINFNSDGIHFHIIDGTGGIKVFQALEDLGYTVTEGDSVQVRGYIEQFMGQAEIRPDFITLIDGNHPLQIPTVVTSLSEADESSLVTIACVRIAESGQWIPSGTGFIVDMTDGTNTFDVWIDGDTELYNGGVIEGTFTLTGIVEQMDNASPFDNNYVILPRYNEDIVDQVVADFVIPSPIVYGNGGVTIDITNNSVGASSFEWDFGNGDTTEGEVAEYTYSFEALSSLAEISVTLIATGANCTSTTTQTVDLVYSNIEEQDAFELSLYPVPANTMMTLQSAELLEQLQVLDIAGRVVMSLDKLNVYSVNLNVSALANGQYIVRAYSSNAAVVKSFVVSK
ncbi:MAG: lamin tail domain-containing protein [Flavobacteriales bacterium]|jgi:hypothetical protein